MNKLRKITYSVLSFVMVFSILSASLLINITLPTFANGDNNTEDTVYDYKSSWNDSTVWNRYILNQNAGNFTNTTISSGSYSTVNYFNFVAPKDGDITIKLNADVTHGNGSTERFYISKAECEVETVSLTTTAVKPSPTPDFNTASSYKNIVGVFPASRNGLSFTNAVGGTGYFINSSNNLSVDTAVTVK